MLWEIYPGMFDKERDEFTYASEQRQIQEAKETRIARAEAIQQRKFMEKMDELEKQQEGGNIDA